MPPWFRVFSGCEFTALSDGKPNFCNFATGLIREVVIAMNKPQAPIVRAAIDVMKLKNGQ